MTAEYSMLNSLDVLSRLKAELQPCCWNGEGWSSAFRRLELFLHDVPLPTQFGV